MKKLICLACAAGAAMLLGLCGYLQSDERKIKSYLEERHGEEFVVLNISSSGDGRTPFSHSVTAFCTPADDPECVFRTTIENAGTQYPLYIDEYAKTVVCRQIEKTVTEKLGDYFGESFVQCYIYENFSPILPDMDDITYEDYFIGLYRSYPDQESGELIMKYIIAVNSDQYEPQDYGEEYDLLYSLLEEMSDTLHVDGWLEITFYPEILYDRHCDWYSEHTYPSAMPTSYYQYDKYGKKISYEYYRVSYDHITHQSTSFHSYDDVLTRESYVEQRMQERNEG